MNKTFKNNISRPSNEAAFTVAIPQPAENVQLPDPTLLQYYKDKERRLFWILGEVDSSLYELVQAIIDCNREDKGLAPEKRQPIRLVMTSPGGSLDVEQTLTAVIEASVTPIHCIAIGMCASAASMIYLSGHKRFATKNASFLFHQGGCENLEGTYQQIVAFMEKYQADIEEMSKFYKEHTKFPEDVIDEKLSEGDWYISSEEAKANGIVDEIITSLDIFF
jgi:ATP-dependent Clp protease protease subunit